MLSKFPKRLREYWRRLMKSDRVKMSWGAQQVDKIITWSKADKWRRKEKKK